ncbi:hypothetical protein [Nocardia rhizosphaerihabitans]|uniref:Mce-associated membrane protein n=1 Tax=Nocardia rhizosphaerihabitans TaxID=1691570 RepID=A0ABQ2KZA4_9NOCA|nr:hypothetical protein [Nocardia rhizosphaerihabitans]GGN97038.1 hypothetical protein GCM10011610_62640 [Nocardia rhizosphaerihabitans]
MTTDEQSTDDPIITERNDSEPVAADEPIVPEAGAESRIDQAGITRRITLGRTVTLVSMVALVAVGVASYLAVDNHRIRSREDARAAAQQAACAYAPVLARYDAKNLDTYFAAVLAGATGDWKTEFDATSKDLRDVLTQGQVVSTVGNVQCAIESADETTAQAVAVINQTITSLGTKGVPAPGQLSVTMSLRKDADRWLVSKVSSPMLAH